MGDEVTYLGVGFDGKPWQSINPEFLSKTINDYLKGKYGYA